MNTRLRRFIWVLIACMITSMEVQAQTAYVVWCEESTTLYFTYRNEVLTKGETFVPEGETEGMTITSVWQDEYATPEYNNYGNAPFWNNLAYKSLTKIVFEDSFKDVRPTNTVRWFTRCTYLSEISGIENLNTSEVTHMDSMFEDCSGLTSLDLSSFNTENVISMEYMFSGCSNLEVLVQSFNTANVSDMGGMFNKCSKLTSYETNFNTSKVTNMGYMFCNCESLISLDVSGFDTKQVTNMAGMFSGCKELKALDVSNFNTENVTDMYQMFYNNPNLTSITLGSGFKTPKVINMGYMFGSCKALQTLDLSMLSTECTTNMKCMFSQCSTLETVVFGSGFKGEEVKDMSFMFDRCTNLGDIDLSSLTGGKVENMERMFYKSGLRSLTLGDLDASKATTMKDMFRECSNLERITLNSFTTADVTTTEYMFYKCDKLKSLNLSGFRTPELTTAFNMFNGCSALETLDLSNFSVENATNLQSMFCGCSSLKMLDLESFCPTNAGTLYMFKDCCSLESLNLGNFSLESTGTMESMFENCSKLETLDLSKVTPHKVSSFRRMLFGCSSLKRVDLTNFNTESATNMMEMFRNCSSLDNIDVSSFNTSNVTRMQHMFYACSSLGTLDLSSFDTGKVTDTALMFGDCQRLTTIYVSEKWSTQSITNSGGMFAACYKLVGGNGTTFNSFHDDHDYAHIDGGTSNPGYFTFKGQPAPDPEDEIIHFADAEVKRICVENWDTSGDGEISYKEAKAVTSLGKKFAGNKTIESFDELQYFTGLKALDYNEGGEFELCEKLETVTLPEGLEKIGEATFNYCRALKGIQIPASVTEMSYLGGWYYNMTTISVAEGNTVYDSRGNCNAVIETATNTLISGCNKTIIPNGVTDIGPFAFNACVTDPIAIPSSVATIGQSAFSTCLFTDVELPSSVTSIDRSFVGCTRIKNVVCNIAEPFAIDDVTFAPVVYEEAVLWVPTAEAVDKYKATEGWRNFKNVLEKGKTAPVGDDSVASDIVSMTNVIIGGVTDPETKAAADLNGDNVVNIADIIILVNRRTTTE